MLKTLNPKVMTGDVAAAHRHALDHKEPVFMPAAIYADDRGWSIMNQMQGVMTHEGQINYSIMYPNVIKAWHRHHKQTDFWMVLHGHIKIGVYREEDGTAWQLVAGEKKPGVLIIPRPLWHGAATVSNEPAGLLYYVTHAYDPKSPDEDRRDFDSVTGFPWAVQNR